MLASQMDTVAEAGIVGGVTIFTGVLIIITGVICFFPARFVYNFGNKIKNFLQNNSEEELESAFKNNKSLWKFTGIVTIIYMAFLPIMLIASIIAVIGAYL
jgi:flagellar biosynthesis protein FlhB